ncbi:hypothetical protein F5877DRAFT_68898 [Lentinula edodes]|nr:hypothetical protein F5877DRAFT_68898 [Lentinula edodes]
MEKKIAIYSETTDPSALLAEIACIASATLLKLQLMSATSKRQRRGHRKHFKTVQRLERYWKYKAKSIEFSSNNMAGNYALMKPDGKKLVQAIQQDFPQRLGPLCQLDSADHYIIFGSRITKAGTEHNASLLRKWTEVISYNTARRLEFLFDAIIASKAKYANKLVDGNRSTTPAFHWGLWEKCSQNPHMAPETWLIQKPPVQKLIAKFLGILAIEVAPIMVKILKQYFPEQWARQERAYQRVRHFMKTRKILQDKPWLDFGGAFFAVAVKEGNSEIYHLDWSDDREALTWVTGLGTWKGGDLRLVELDVQVPMKEGEALCGCMRQLVHSGSPIRIDAL